MTYKIDELSEEEITKLIAKDLKGTPFVSPSVYRLQLNSKFRFEDATQMLDYLKTLGVKAVYTSPYFKATPGSAHGYDVTNPNEINPDLGTPAEHEQFCDELQKRGMGHILDIVPNHMGIGKNANEMWLDVLENGPSSIFAHYFDIDWDPDKRELHDRVLIPILGDHYGVLLEKQEIQLVFSEMTGTFYVKYWEHILPIAPKTYPMILNHDIKRLKDELGSDHSDVLSLMNVITILDHLPPREERDLSCVLERNHEKEIAKERLTEIVSQSKDVQAFINRNVEIFNGAVGKRKSFDLLDNLLNEQAYRMAYWRVAAEEINYRRFFDVNDLAAIRMEDDSVFQEHHRLAFQLVEQGKVSGFRIDHPDGLYDPPNYFRELQFRRIYQVFLKAWRKHYNISDPIDIELQDRLYFRLKKAWDVKKFDQVNPLYIIVEKILERKEQLPPDWRVHGTVGYDFLNAANGVFVDWDQGDVFSEIYEKFIGSIFDFEIETYVKKKYVALVHMASEVLNLAKRLDRVSEKDRRYRDFTLNNITVAIREVIACFPVYRTYTTPNATEVSERDQKYIHIAIEKAKSRTPALPHTLYDFLRNMLLLKLDPDMEHEDERLYRDIVMRFQQLTAPIMAKGLEDTAFYVYNRLISLNEVGGDPEHFGTTRTEFHRINGEHAKDWPKTMISTSTHDTKRSEDVRMKINVLSEIPLEWQAELTRWTALNEKHKTWVDERRVPDANTEYFIYQTLIGAWPNSDFTEESRKAFFERLWSCVEKSIREAKLNTNWIQPNCAYEEGVKLFLSAILKNEDDNHFLQTFIPFQKRIAEFGMRNSLSLLVLKMASPGVVETYQGTELWDDSLVDPDNRRPVDFQLRQQMLAEIVQQAKGTKKLEGFVHELLATKESGKIKLYLLWRGLNFRSKHEKLFLEGDYLPLRATGDRDRNVIAFLRKKNKKIAICITARFFNEIAAQDAAQKSTWEKSQVELPDFVTEAALKEVYTGKSVPLVEKNGKKVIELSTLFNGTQFALLTNASV